MVVDNSPLLVLSQLGLKRRQTSILTAIDCEISNQGTTLIMGPNGSGKTSLLRTIYGLQKPSTGKIDWHHTQQSNSRAFIFQTPIVMRRDVVSNIAYPLQVRGVPRTLALEKAKLFAEKFGLQERLKHDANRLSGGEKQKLALARAMIIEPALLCLDEPTTNLDGQSTIEIESILQDAVQQGTKLLLASHDMGQAKRLADDVLLLHKGRLIEQNKASLFFTAPKTAQSKAFLKGDILL